MSVELRVAKKDDGGAWDAIVDASQQGTIFHTWKWLRIIEKHTKSRLYPLIGLKGSEIIGIYPLLLQKNIFLRSVFSPPPMVAVPYLGPIILGYDKLKQDKKELLFIEFQKKVDEFIKFKLRPHYTSIRLSPNLPDCRPFKWSGYQVEPLYNYTINLTKGEDYVWMQFKKRLRKDINRLYKKEISVEAGSKDDFEWIYNSMGRRYEEQDRFFSISKGYLLDVYDSFYPQNLKIFVAKYNGELLSGSIKIHYKNMLLSWIGSMKANVDASSPNDLLQWEVIKWAIEHGVNYYELMGANTERICRYKSKFNPELLINCSAKKYSSYLLKLVETGYIKLFKPILYTKFKKWL